MSDEPLTGRALANEKRKDYRNTVIFQVTMVLFVLLLEDGFRLVGVTLPQTGLKLLFHALLAGYLVLLWDLFRNFTRRRWLIRAVLGTLVLSFSSLFAVDVVLGLNQFQATVARVLCHLAILGVELATIVAAIYDLFRGPRRAVDKLWGSACIYFMSAFAFTGVFYCILVLDPQAFGRALPPDSWALFEALYLSLNSLVGLDTVYPDSIRLVRNVALAEGLWSQLYMVLLIGRLLTNEDGPEASTA